VRRSAPLALLISLAIAGCGSADQDKTPVGCLSGGAKFYYSALQNGRVNDPTFSGYPLVSDCLAKNQSGGELANVGGTLVQVATQLNAKARANPAGPAAVQLGFLVGAASRGAAKTGGIHTVLLERLTAAARYSPGGQPLAPAFKHEYEKGYAAGKDHG
jgi:hypothetical protein